MQLKIPSHGVREIFEIKPPTDNDESTDNEDEEDRENDVHYWMPCPKRRNFDGLLQSFSFEKYQALFHMISFGMCTNCID